MINQGRYIRCCYRSEGLRLLFHRRYQEHANSLPVKLSFSVTRGAAEDRPYVGAAVQIGLGQSHTKTLRNETF